MGGNKGKKGEMRLVKTLSNIVSVEEDHNKSCDVTRHTNTNTADSGADAVLESPVSVVTNSLHIANDNGKIQSGAIHGEVRKPLGDRRIKTRFDFKNTKSKLGSDTVRKFGGDIRKNPDCDGHLLVGGEGLTKGGKQEFKSLIDAYGKEKIIAYISNEGFRNIEKNYDELDRIQNEKEKIVGSDTNTEEKDN